MRVLLVSHLFPPRHRAGTELYTLELGRRLCSAGHEVHVLTTEKDIAQEDGAWSRREQEGLVVHERINNLYYDEFEETWSRPQVDGEVGRLLDELKPDLVHVHHLMYLSLGILAEIKARDLPLVYTLHDFWLACPRFGQLKHADGSVCHQVEPERCGTCLPSFAWRQSELQRTVGRALAKTKALTGLDLSGAAKRLATRSSRGGGEDSSPPNAAEQVAWAGRVERRQKALLELARQHVDRFVAPSEYLRDWLVNWGLPEQRVSYLPTGVDREAFGEPPQRRDPGDGPLRVAFIGTLVPVKGAHLLLEAWSLLDEDQRSQARLWIHGPRDHAPDYQASLARQAEDLGVELSGALQREEVARALAACDVLVVPSLWFENRPLVVLEALATQTPLLVSVPGGMAELVQEGVHGWHFALGDAQALKQRLADLIQDREPLRRLYSDEVQLPTWEALMEATMNIYEDLQCDR